MTSSNLIYNYLNLLFLACFPPQVLLRYHQPGCSLLAPSRRPEDVVLNHQQHLSYPRPHPTASLNLLSPSHTRVTHHSPHASLTTRNNTSALVTTFRTPEPSKADKVLYTRPATPATSCLDGGFIGPCSCSQSHVRLEEGSRPRGMYFAARDSQISIPLVVSLQTSCHRLVEKECERVSIPDYDDFSSCER
jgi:hypothetical protein